MDKLPVGTVMGPSRQFADMTFTYLIKDAHFLSWPEISSTLSMRSVQPVLLSDLFPYHAALNFLQ
ncbi:MAG: hypothetical protein Kow0083_06870 [Methylophaga sp.]